MIVQKIVEGPQIRKRTLQQTVGQNVEEIVQVPKVEYVEEIQIQKFITPQLVKQIVEEIVQAPKIEYQEEIVETQVEQVVTV